MKRIFLFIAGIISIFIGILGLVLPVLPGWPFIFLGLSLVAPALAARIKRRILRVFFKKDVVYLDEWKKHRVCAGFTTRHFPLVLHKTGDLLDASNQDVFKKLFFERGAASGHGIVQDLKFAILNQVHEDAVAVLEEGKLRGTGDFYHFERTDAAITNIHKLALLVMTADCLPIFFMTPKPAQWVGLAHAGWQGTQKGIAKRTLKLIAEKSGYSPADIRIAFGPCIGRDRYEVGEEFKRIFPKGSFHLKNNKIYFNLAGENRRQLMEAGALEKRILDYGACTFSENEDFYSFRKERDAAGRIISFIAKVQNE